MKKVKIQTRRLVLKSHVLTLKPYEVYDAINHPDTLKYMCSVPAIYTYDTAKMFLSFLQSIVNDPSMLELGIFEYETDKFIGMVT